VTVRAQPTQQCSAQSAYPSPLDGNGKPIDALVQVDLSSLVGVVLDDLPSTKLRCVFALSRDGVRPRRQQQMPDVTCRL
jgi:hypothetical protein